MELTLTLLLTLASHNLLTLDHPMEVHHLMGLESLKIKVGVLRARGRYGRPHAKIPQGLLRKWKEETPRITYEMVSDRSDSSYLEFLFMTLMATLVIVLLTVIMFRTWMAR